MIGPLFQSQREVLNWAGGFIALSLVVILGFMCFALVNQEIPKANENIIFALVGGIMTQVTQITGFFFGSSQQAKKQADTIEHMARTSAGPQIVAKAGDTVTTQTDSETKITEGRQ
jgi:hypothetical protein